MNPSKAKGEQVRQPVFGQRYRHVLSMLIVDDEADARRGLVPLPVSALMTGMFLKMVNLWSSAPTHYQHLDEDRFIVSVCNILS
jgi:hypothetical protein